MSHFSQITAAPKDPILGLKESYLADNSSNKVDLGIGAYRTEEGKPYVLNVIREVEKELMNENLNKEYIPQDGLKELNTEACKLIFGDSCEAIKHQRIVTLQSLSGTGALRLGVDFIKKFLPNGTKVFLPTPSWANHKNIMIHANVPFSFYRYYDQKTRGLAFSELIEDINQIPEKSIILFHACAHNPTGVDPSIDQWKEIANVCKKRNIIPFFDCAYQGFATGDIDKDAFAIRHFTDMGFELFCAQSFAKNFGMYGERIGCLHIVCKDKNIASNVLSQMKVIVRGIYSSPPVHGARIIARVLQKRKKEWETELAQMSKRIRTMREKLRELLESKNCGKWEHITNQIGMFSFTGLTEKQCEMMTEKYHIYLLKNGRISMAGLNSKNIQYVADAICDCVTNY